MRKNIISLVYFGIMFSSVYALPAEIVKFDFGTDNSPVASGFTKVTENTIYNHPNGYGWKNAVSSQRRFAKDRNKYEDIGRDYVATDKSEFIVNLPADKYVINILTSYLGYGEYDRCLKWGAEAEGKEFLSSERWSFESAVKLYFKGFSDNYRRTDNAWNKCVRPLYPMEKFVVDVRDGKLNLVLRNIKLNALVIYPLKAATKGKRIIGEINVQRRKQFESAWKRILTDKPDVKLKITGEQRRKGYLLFSRNWMNKVYPETVPEPDEIDHKVKLVCALQEREPASLIIYPLADLKNVSVKIERLKTVDGVVFPTSNIELKVEKYRFEPSPANQTYTVTGAQIVPFKTLNIDRSVTTKIWLECHVPPKTVPGIYSGSIRVKPENRPAQEIGVMLKVLPFSLKLDPKRHNFALQHITPRQYKNFTDRQDAWDYFEKELRFLKRYGFTMPTIGYDGATKPNFRWDSEQHKVQGYDIKNIRKFMELYKKIGGFPSPYIVYGLHHLFAHGNYKIHLKKNAEGWATPEQPQYIWKAFVDVVSPIKKAQAKNKWPEFQFIATGELSNGGLEFIKYGQKYLTNLHKIPGIKLQSVVISANELKMLAPYDNICGVSTHISTPANIAIAKKRSIDHKFWLYQTFNRFTYGFYFHKIGASGSFKEDFDFVSCTPYNSFDGWRGEFSFCTEYSLPSPDGPVPIYKTYDDLEGIDDARYVYTLETYIKKTKAIGTIDAVSQAAASQAVLDGIMRRINPDLTYYTNQVGYWDNSVYDKVRWKITAEILKLMKFQQGVRDK